MGYPNYPPTFQINSDSGCIGRIFWVNTIQQPEDWICGPWPFPVWGVIRWFRTRTHA